MLLQNLKSGDHSKNGESKYMTANRCRDYVYQVPCKPGLKNDSFKGTDKDPFH